MSGGRWPPAALGTSGSAAAQPARPLPTLLPSIFTRVWGAAISSRFEVCQPPLPPPPPTRWTQRLDFLMTEELSNGPEQGRGQPSEAKCKIDISTSLITY